MWPERKPTLEESFAAGMFIGFIIGAMYVVLAFVFKGLM